MINEQEFLLSRLRDQRSHVLAAVATMPEQVMLAPLFPSQWSPARLIHHLTHDVERFWFCKVLCDDPEWQGMPDGIEAWDVPENRTARDIVDEYVAETAIIDDMLARTSLDAAPLWWDTGLFGHAAPADLGEIIIHVMIETATHAGHLDIARELYDNGQFLVLTNESRPGRPAPQ